jgi:phenylacetic acid degradation operon negative regulatory protein
MNGTRHAADPAPIRSLLRHFRARRPLRGGSLIITVFGDAIAPRGGAVTLGSLIRLAAPLGLTERLVRTSVARLAREGWLLARRSGRRSEYRLTASGAARFAEATRRIYAQSPQRWDGHWTLVLLAVALRSRKVRRELRWLGFGELTPSLLAHPGCTPQQARRHLAPLTGTAAPLVLRSLNQELAVDRQLASRGWDLKELARRYRRFVRRFSQVESAVAGAPIAPHTAFAVRTLLIHEYRKIHLQDPLLPPQLLPQDWVGAAAYELCRRLYAQVFASAEGYLSVTAHRLKRPLPAASAAARSRFSGVEAARARPSP